MNSKARISKSALGVIIGLVVSVWWIFMGLDLGFRFEASELLAHIRRLPSYHNDNTCSVPDSGVCPGEAVGFSGSHGAGYSHIHALGNSHRLHGDYSTVRI